MWFVKHHHSAGGFDIQQGVNVGSIFLAKAEETVNVSIQYQYRRLGISDEHPILSILDHLFYDETGHPLRSQTSSSQATRRSKGLRSSQLSSRGLTCLKPSDPINLRLWEDGKHPICKRGCDIMWHEKNVSTLWTVMHTFVVCGVCSVVSCEQSEWLGHVPLPRPSQSQPSYFARRSRFPAVSDEKYLQPTCSTRCRPRPAKGHDLPPMTFCSIVFN